MNDWSHGYEVSAGYTHTFYREMAPDWLDLCAAVAGSAGSRNRDSGKFRYLELGSGQGVGLCLLAAANPDAEFVGVDFMPDHIAHSEKIAREAGLNNVRFAGADFLDLSREWPEYFGTFDYVTLHGIYTWVVDPIRDAVDQCLAHATHPGSLVYVGYNSQPGWLESMPFQHITQVLNRGSDESGAAVIEKSIALFDRLLEGNALTFQIKPSVKYLLDKVKTEDPAYLTHEYLNDGWRPMWHSEIAGRLAMCGIDHVASATIVENLLPDVLPPKLREPILEQENLRLRQDLQDFVLNQSFRRDIFRRGPSQASADLSSIRLRLLSPPTAGDTIRVETSFGNAELRPESFADVLATLHAGSSSIDELTSLSKTTKDAVLRMLLYMLESPAIIVETARPSSADPAQRLNAVLARAVCEGATYSHLAAAQFGSAIPASKRQMLLFDCWLQSSGTADQRALADGLSERARKLGLELPDGALTLARSFLERSLPRLRQFGCVA